jgi:hypothetical protein
MHRPIAIAMRCADRNAKEAPASLVETAVVHVVRSVVCDARGAEHCLGLNLRMK